MAAPRSLLVEDDRDTAGLLEHVLIAADYTVDVVASAAEAMQRVAENRYGLIIADWRLADGDGLAVVDRAADLGMKTAVLTGYAFGLPPDTTTRHEVWLKPMRP